MNGKEVRALKNEEIQVELKRLRAHLFTLRGQTVTEKVEDNSQFAKTRRDIARLLTERTARLHGKTGAAKTGGEEPAKSSGRKRSPVKTATAAEGASPKHKRAPHAGKKTTGTPAVKRAGARSVKKKAAGKSATRGKA
ncbi:MAG: 50S ribosomal protein L29 [Phycisphaerales bacterium]|nr:50S ribosomal protein L29 [Phycisphaerales bacterium]